MAAALVALLAYSFLQVAATVLRGDAQQLAFPDGTFDAVIVDPPYYDAIQYGDLSDFFYVWLKRSIGHLHPGVLARR